MGLLDIEEDDTWRWYGGYCIEADVGAAAIEAGIIYGEQGAIDGRVQYLTWFYDVAYAQANQYTKYLEFAAVQALVWAWLGDGLSGSKVFAGLNAPYTEPLNWNGLVTNSNAGAKAWDLSLIHI